MLPREELNTAEVEGTEGTERQAVMRTSRRDFVKTSFVAVCAAGIGSDAVAVGAKQSAARLPIKKGLVFDMLPGSMSVADRFKLAKDVGFDVVQAPTTPDEREAEEIKRASEAVGIRIDSVMNMDHWKYPLSS